MGSSPVRAMAARAYGSISTDPLFGQAVHAPMVSGPNATPRVSVNQVAPKPMAVASNKGKKDPKNNRMAVHDIRGKWPLFSMGAAVRPKRPCRRKCSGMATLVLRVGAEPQRHRA